MSAYTERVTLTVPEALVGIAKQISRAMDPDVGGHEAFQPATDEEGNVIAGPVSYTTNCVPEFAQALAFFKAQPALLHESVARDYAARWPDLTPPTLAEVEAFCAAVEIINHAQETPAWPTN